MGLGHPVASPTDEILFKIRFIDLYNNLTCLPIQLKTIEELSKAKAIKKSCLQMMSSKKIMKYWQKIMIFSYRKCLKPCNILEYQGQTEIKDKIIPGKIQISLSLSSDEVKVQEEYLIYNEVDLVGIIGGTLGLFIGFSFFDIVNDMRVAFESARRQDVLIFGLQNYMFASMIF